MCFSTLSIASDSCTFRIDKKHFSPRKRRSCTTNCLHIGSSTVNRNTTKPRECPLKGFEFVELTLVDGSNRNAMNKQVNNGNNRIQKCWVIHDKNARGFIAHKELVFVPTPPEPNFCNQTKNTYCQPLKKLGRSWKITKRRIVIIIK